MAGVIIPTKLPDFTYSNSNYTTELRTDWGWLIYFKGSGTFTVSANTVVDIFLVGGGGGAGYNVGGGGGGGYTKTYRGVQLLAGEPYSVTIGAGGAQNGGNGGTSWFGEYYANGGKGGGNDYSGNGGNGGSGGGASGGRWHVVPGGSNGGNGGDGGGGSTLGSGKGGRGQGTTTRAFEDSSFGLYAGGGGGGCWDNSAGWGGAGGGGNANSGGTGGSGSPNTGGGGGGGGDWNYGGTGGSGIVIIRNSSIELYPIIFNDSNKIKSFTYNEKMPSHFIFNTKSLF